MNIATALNNRYIPYTTTMLTSLCENNECHISAYLFHSELDRYGINDMKKSLSSYDIELIPLYVDKKVFDDKFPRSEQWSLEAYYRLFMFDMIPEDVDRILYLDGDIIINKDLSDFYKTSFDDAEMIVCDDKSGLNVPENYGNKHREMFKTAYEKGFRYFNSGMLLIDISKMRSKYKFDVYLKAIEKWDYEMEAPDQDILNYMHWDKVKYADYNKYDMFARIAHNRNNDIEHVLENVSIIHYTGYKPWECGNFHFDIEMIWWEYAKKTIFYKDLLQKFVIDILNDTSVANYLRKLERERYQKKKLLEKTLKKLEMLYSGEKINSNAEKNTDENDAFDSLLDSEEWEYGYIYSEEQKRQWTKLIEDGCVEEMERFLNEIMFDPRAEEYAIILNNDIAEIDAGLKKAEEIIGSFLNE